MPISFPSNPSSGDTYDFGGIHYIYNGDGWVNKSIYGVSAGSGIVFTNYNGTGPVVISSSSGSGITSAVTSIRGLSGAVGLTAGQDIEINIVGNTFTISSPTVYGISANIYASNLATGLLHGGIVSINAGNTARFDLTSGSGQIHASGSTYTVDPQPTYQYVTWPGQTNIAVTNLATADTTWLYIDSTGTLNQRTEYYTDDQLENTIIIGQIVHPTRTYINLARTNPNVAYATDKQYEQFIRAFGPIKISGHTITANGANLKLNRSAGKAFSLGRNWINNTDDPSVVSDIAQTDCIFYRYYRGVTAGSFVTVPNQTQIDPTKYDDGTGILATVPGGKYTIQRLFFYPNTPTLLGVYYGRAQYTSIADAAANINLESFSELENTKTNAIFAGFLIVKAGTTDLTNTSDALIIQAGSFRSTTSGGGTVSLTLDDLTDVIITSPQNYQVLTYVDGVTGWENLSVTALPLVSSFNGKTGAIQGVSSINGATGAITNVAFTNAAQTFSALQSFSSGISASGGITFGNNISIKSASGDLTVGTNTGALNTVIFANNSLVANNSIANSVIIGKDAMSSSGAASTDSFAIGFGALNSNDASSNFGIGVAAGYSTTLGGENFFIGNNAGYGCVEGSANVAIGPSVLQNINNGTENTGIGYFSLISAVDTNFNTAIGSSSLQNTTSGSENTAVGYGTLISNTTGAGNIALGYNAGRYRGTATLGRTTGTGGIYIGYQSRASANAMTDEIVIGRNAVGLGSSTAVIGATAQSSATIYGVMNLPGGLSASGGITFNSNIKINNKAILGSAALGNATPGCIEFDGNVLYAGTTGGRGLIETPHVAFASSAVSLSGVTTYQSIFTSPADVLTLAANSSYMVEGHIIIQSGTTTHTTAVRLLDFTAGVAPIFRLTFIVLNAAAGTVQRAQDMVYFETSGGVINATSDSARTIIILRGAIETADSVTITPQVAFSANPGVTNQTQEGSWIKFTPVGTNTVTSVGPWT